MEILYKNVNHFFEEVLSDLKCRRDTCAYIISIFSKYKSSEFDLSKDNITLLFSQARAKQDFLSYQILGDWIFFSNIIYPEHLKYASKDYYDNIGRLSYYSCYKLINKQWKLFEELSDQFLTLEEQIKNRLNFTTTQF